MPALLIIGLAFFLAPKDFTEKLAQQNTNKNHESSHHHDHHDHDHQHHSKDSHKSSSTQVQEVTREGYLEQVKYIEELGADVTKNKKKLLSIVLAEDIYKGKDRNVEPHSIDEIRQNQQGALKVMALRALMKQEENDVLTDDLNDIITEAKDPTIRNIASAALDSLKKGRPFFTDFLNGLSSTFN